MKYHVRRADRELKDDKSIEEVLKKGKYATIALCKNDEPYIVTLSYGYEPANRTFYFHAAKQGVKIDFIRSNPDACLTVIEDNGYIQGQCSHSYRSVVARGVMELVDDENEKRHGTEILIKQLEEKPEIVMASLEGLKERYEIMQILKFRIIEMTGKKGK